MPHSKLRRYNRHGLLPQLFVFEAVSRLGSVTRAGEELHLAQPTVSLQLKKLAETLDITPFEQVGRRLQLTASGHALREVCDELMTCLERSEEKLAAWRRPCTERLALAAEPEARAVASRLLAAFCARHPGTQATLHIAERDELLARFAAGTDDVYLFELEVEGIPAERRWSVARSKRRELAQSAAQFLRETLLDGDALQPAPAIAPRKPDEQADGEHKRRRQ